MDQRIGYQFTNRHRREQGRRRSKCFVDMFVARKQTVYVLDQIAEPAGVTTLDVLAMNDGIGPAIPLVRHKANGFPGHARIERIQAPGKENGAEIGDAPPQAHILRHQSLIGEAFQNAWTLAGYRLSSEFEIAHIVKFAEDLDK